MDGSNFGDGVSHRSFTVEYVQYGAFRDAVPLRISMIPQPRHSRLLDLTCSIFFYEMA